MGEMSWWERAAGWLRHPLHHLGATIAAGFCERNGLVMDFADMEPEVPS